MPGFELIDDLERDAVTSIFSEGGTLFAHGFDSLRKKYHVREFEKQCESYFSIPHASALTSGTAALKCALKAIGVQPGDEVITQSFNFIATIEAILDCGAKPEIINVDQNLHLDLLELERKISPKTKCIIVVHMLGMPGPVNSILDLAKSLDIPVIEDACEIVGGKIGNKFAGTVADIGVFSFDHGKNLTCGEGGMTLTKNPDYSRYIRSYSDHGHAFKNGLSRGKDTALFPGFNYRMTEMQAAVGKVQLSKLQHLINLNAERYTLLESRLQSTFRIRSLCNLDDKPSCDTLMLVDLTEDCLHKILEILSRHQIGTKNIPDAMNWHCSYFWGHALSKQQVSHSLKTQQYLSSSIAIPILARKPLEFYDKLASDIISVR